MAPICLAMIVKNEAHVIERCLASVRPYIARWVICDTGSTDDTCDRVLDALSGIRGELHTDRWKDFGHNRSLSLERAQRSGCDYTLVIDADEELAIDDPAVLDELGADCYLLRTYDQGLSWLQQRLLRSALPWRFEGIMHEHLVVDAPIRSLVLDGASLATKHDGARAQDPLRHEQDIALMKRAMEENPGDTRTLFHLMLGYRLAGRYDEALAAAEQRWQMDGGMDYEAWYARYQMGHLYQQTGRPALAPAAFLDTYADFPACAEPLYWLGRYYMERELYEHALPYLELAYSKKRPETLFIAEESIYQWEAGSYYARCLVKLGRPADATYILRQLIEQGRLPAGVLSEETERELDFAQMAVGG